MKVYILLFPLLLANACKTTTDSNSSSSESNTEISMSQNESCPEGGDCSFNLKKNTLMMVKEDEATGKYYPVFAAGDNTIFEYKFLQTGPDGTVDGDYSETIHFVIPDFQNSLTLNGNELQEVELLFSKQCYCKGEAGSYKVNNGKLILNKIDGNLKVDLSFSVSETSQKITTISKTVKL